VRVSPSTAVTHGRGGHRDPESQAFIESWFGKLKQRCVWREEFETIDQARETIGAYITTYDRRPHSGLNYKTTAQVAGTRKDHQDQAIPAA
jgi:putative transposase